MLKPHPGRGIWVTGALLFGVVGLAAWWIGMSGRTESEPRAAGEQLAEQPSPADVVSAPSFQREPPSASQESLAPLDFTEEVSRDSATSSRPGPRLAALVIIVVDSDGQPVGDASVEVWAIGQAAHGVGAVDPSAQLLRTDPSGACQLSLAQSAVKVFASKEGVGTSGLWRGERVPDEALRLELRAMGRIVGQVIQTDGCPVPGVQVSVRPNVASPAQVQPRSPEPVTSDLDGRFAVEVDAPFHGTVVGLLGTESSTENVVLVNPGETETATIRFGRGYVISGSVVSADGVPIAHAEVTLERGPDLLSLDGFEPAKAPVSTSGDGRFVLELAVPGLYSLIVDAEGWIQSNPDVAVITKEAPSVEVIVECVPAGSISGHVLWEDGEPVHDAFITADLDEPDLRDMSFEQRQQLEALAWSREDGAFRLGPLHPSYRYSVEARKVDASTALHGVVPGSAELTVNLSRQQALPVALRGRVVDLDSGSPIPKFETSVSSWYESTGISSMSVKWTAHDAADGRFVVADLRANKNYAVSIRAVGFQPRTFRAELDSAEHEYALGHPVELTVEVATESGEPAQGVLVALLEDMNPAGMEPPRHQGNSGPEGMVAFSSLDPGAYWLMAAGAAGSAGPSRVDVGGEAAARMRLRLTAKFEKGRLDVHLLDRGGSPVQAAKVMLWPLLHAMSDEQVVEFNSVETDGSGLAVMNPRPGIYHVLASRGSLLFPSRRLVIGAGEKVELELRAE